MRKIVFLMLISIAFLSCKKEENELGSKLRLKNETLYQIESAFIKLGNSENIYGSLNPNEISDYKNFNDKGYPYIKLKINNKDIEFKIQPFEAPPTKISNEAVKPLTCVITYKSSSNSFGVHFIE